MKNIKPQLLLEYQIKCWNKTLHHYHTISGSVGLKVRRFVGKQVLWPIHEEFYNEKH